MIRAAALLMVAALGVAAALAFMCWLLPDAQISAIFGG